MFYVPFQNDQYLIMFENDAHRYVCVYPMSLKATLMDQNSQNIVWLIAQEPHDLLKL